jgi:ATP-dependent RNA helicase RhlE
MTLMNTTQSPSNFASFPLGNELQRAITEAGYTLPTPIQQQAIPHILAQKDLLGIAQTGTGKTAAFCLPTIARLIQLNLPYQPRSTKALVLTPTRELAIQIHQQLMQYGKYTKQRYAVVFGGVSQYSQVQALQRGVDVLVATPGRLLDLISQRLLSLSDVNIFILDEADRMLDMGFLRDVKKILPLLPKERHNLFFSATMPREIASLAQEILRQPQIVEVTPPATTVERIEQSVLYVDKKDKMNLLVHYINQQKDPRVLVFVEMKHMANKVVEKLLMNRISAAAIHGNKSQNARQKALEDFASGRVRALVATDIASRGIDIDGITHVINFELSHMVESYVHRIGRTARAGKDGQAVTFCDADEKSYLKAIEKETRQEIPVNLDHHYHCAEAMDAPVLSLSRAKAMKEKERLQRRPMRSPRSKSGQGSNNRSRTR